MSKCQAEYLMMMGALAEMPKNWQEDIKDMEGSLLELVQNSDKPEKELWILAMGLIATKWELGKIDLEGGEQ